MSCWCGADTQQHDYPPFEYFCTADDDHWPFAAVGQVTIEEVLADVIPSRTSDPDTSHAATREVKIKAQSQRAHLLRSFAINDDLTDEEAMDCAYPVVSPTSEYAKRCSELREGGFIEPTGETRAGSAGPQRIVSRITAKGRAWIEANR